MIRRGVKSSWSSFAADHRASASATSAPATSGSATGCSARGYVVTADFAESGGIFANAEVTYRGVAVGRVDRLRLRRRRRARRPAARRAASQVPADTGAVVANRSAVGEQYVDLQPRRQRRAVPRRRRPDRRATGPAPRCTPRPCCSTWTGWSTRSTSATWSSVIDELGRAFAGTGPDLQRLLDSGDALTRAAVDALPETIRLIEDGQTVLATQRDSGSAITSFSTDLADAQRHPAHQRRRPAQGPRQRRRRVPASCRRLLARPTGRRSRRCSPTCSPAAQVTVARLRRRRADAGHLPGQRGRRLHRGPRRRHLALRAGPQRRRPAGLHRRATAAPTSGPRSDTVDRPGQHRRPLHRAAREQTVGPRRPERAGAPGRSARTGPGRDRTRTSRAAVSPSYLTGYDPTSGLALGAGGSPLVIGSSGGQARGLRKGLVDDGCCSDR